MSHPVWVRGLKHFGCVFFFSVHFVAPRVGAWIETRVAKSLLQSTRVAPRVGAWIETPLLSLYNAQQFVAPRVDAKISFYPNHYIIETVQFKLPHQNQASYYRYSSLKQS